MCEAEVVPAASHPELELSPYDGDGLRVKKVSGATTTVFVYDVTGELAAEYTTPAPALGGRRFFSEDHLGSTRLITDAGGAVLERHDYRPFGDEVTFTAGQVRANVAGYGVDQATRVKFTGKERDAESGLDFFGARYLSSAQGRWMIPDWSAAPTAVPYSQFSDPQTLNLYAYVRDNPLSKADPDGHGDGISFQKVLVFLQHAEAVVSTKLGIGLGWQFGRTVGDVGGQAGAAAKVNLTVPVLRPDKPSLTLSAEAGGKGSLGGVLQGTAQFKTEATVVKDGHFAVSGFQDKSSANVSMPLTGTSVGTGNNLTLVGATQTLPVLGPLGVVASGELNVNTQEAASAAGSARAAAVELGHDLMTLLGVQELAGAAGDWCFAGTCGKPIPLSHR